MPARPAPSRMLIRRRSSDDSAPGRQQSAAVKDGARSWFVAPLAGITIRGAVRTDAG